MRHFIFAVAVVFFVVPTLVQAQKTKDYTVLAIGTEEVKYSEVLEVWKTLFPSAQPPDFSTFDESVKQNVLRGIASERLLYQEAIKAGFDKNEEVQRRLEALKKQIVIQGFVDQFTKTLVSDASIKAAYEERAAQLKNEDEVRARHILVAKEEEASALIEQLKKGGDFEKLAKEKSTDKGSGAKGGDLGFFTKDKMVPAFAEAAFKLKKGEVSAPVKSEFGWHIIRLDERRKAKVPGFEEMREDLKKDVQQKGLQAYVEGLVKAADVKYFDASGKALPLNSTAPKP